MRIGVISDTHRSSYAIYEIVKVVSNMDLLIHLGDNVRDVLELKKHVSCPIIKVRGNCDYERDTPKELIEIVGGKKIFITHGHDYKVKFNTLRLKYRALEVEADIALYGHTHIADISFEEGIWIINPGSPTLPRDGRASIAVIDLENNSINPYIHRL